MRGLSLPALIIGLAAGPAFAQDDPPEPQPSNLAMTSLGGRVVGVPAIGQADADALLGQRLRWSVGEVRHGYNRLWLDARFTIDPVREVVLERSRVSRLGVELRRGNVVVDLGRAPVRWGGPRLVDGVQAHVRAGQLRVGAWAGLAPDLFTTIPRLRPAGGPMVAVEGGRGQASLVGELAMSPEMELDRLASLAMVRWTGDRWLDLSGRLDMDLVSADGGPRLADGQALVVVRPTDTWRFEALYNAFSSLRYLQTEPLDPLLRRYQQRILDLGVAFGVQQDFLDPTVNHLVGGTVGYRDPSGLGAAFRASVDGRYRYHPNPENRYARAHAEVGLGEIPVGGALDVALDGAVVDVHDGMQLDNGLTVVFEPTEERTWALDGSFRVLLAPTVYDGVGWYTDLFVDAVPSRSWLLAGGVSAVREPDPDFDDLGLGAFARVSAAFR